MALAWQGLGRTALPVIRSYYDHENVAVRLAALEAGLPDCSGVALGVDRLVMLACGAGHIQEVLAFPADRA